MSIPDQNLTLLYSSFIGESQSGDHMLRRWSTILASFICAIALSFSTYAQVTAFGEDVNAAVDDGLAWLDARGVFNNPSSAGDAAGLTTLALLEKRESADQNAAGQGYDGANAQDQQRIVASMNYILGRASERISTHIEMAQT